jgi:hypothetical protein
MTMHEPTNLKRWTMPNDYAGETWPNHYSAGVGQSRDSDCLEESNFAAMLKALGGESEVVTVVRENHWAVGWVEWIAIEDDGSEESATALRIADELRGRLDDYPILDESDYSDRETSAANDVWRDCYDAKQRIEYIREHRNQFEFYDFADMLSCVRGNYFAGYASELIR